MIRACKNSIAVNATALKSGGALSILRQLLYNIPDDKHYYIFIAQGLKLEYKISRNIHLIEIDTSTVIKRVLWDWFGLKRWFKQRKLIPLVTFSLQNTSVRCHKASQQLIYLHQGLSLHHKKWSFLKKKERSFAFYKYIYPFFIFLFANKKTKFIVQTQWMKTALSVKYSREEQNIFVIKPDLEPIDVDRILTIDLPYSHTLFYPAASHVFKNHKEIVYALNEIKNSGFDITSIGLYLTITEHDDEELTALINRLNLSQNIHFLGALSYEQVLVYYKSCTTVVFPSFIESFGLPLIEAAMFAKPLVVLDAEYSREVISKYPYVYFAPYHSPKSWQNAILQSFSLGKQLKSYRPSFDSSWSSVFKLM